MCLNFFLNFLNCFESFKFVSHYNRVFELIPEQSELKLTHTLRLKLAHFAAQARDKFSPSLQRQLLEPFLGVLICEQSSKFLPTILELSPILGRVGMSLRPLESKKKLKITMQFF